MWKIAAISVILGLQSACSALGSHATAARELWYGGPGPVMHCWRRGIGNSSGPCVQVGVDKDILSCANEVRTIGKAFQETRISRAEIIACMHARDWQEFEIWVSS